MPLVAVHKLLPSNHEGTTTKFSWRFSFGDAVQAAPQRSARPMGSIQANSFKRERNTTVPGAPAIVKRKYYSVTQNPDIHRNHMLKRAGLVSDFCTSVRN